MKNLWGMAAAVLVLAVFAWAGTEGHKKGRLALTFDRYNPLSDTESVSNRLRVPVKAGPINNHHYDIKDETFEVYVPEAYEPNQPYGLLVWVAAGPSGAIEPYKGWREMMDKHKLIWVGANRSGNETDVLERRIPLALDAAYNMPFLYTIDMKRIYLAGLSGGGRVASVAALHYSDVYDGGLFIIGANYWEQMRIPGQPHGYWRANTSRPRTEYLRRAREWGRYVLLTGDKDDNRLQMHTYYERGFRKFLQHVLYMQVPGMGHEVPPPEAFDEALAYLEQREDEQEGD